MSHTSTVKRGLSQQACAISYEASSRLSCWNVEGAYSNLSCNVIMEDSARNLKDYHIRQSSNTKLFGINTVWEDDVEDKDDSDWVENMDNDSVMRDDSESDE
jgi:hypothetical protein